MSPRASTRLRLANASLDWRAVEGEILALDTGSSQYLSVNRMGAVLWHQLAAGTSREELVQRLMTEAGIDAPRAASDVDVFVGQLAAQGLVLEEPADGTGP